MDRTYVLFGSLLVLIGIAVGKDLVAGNNNRHSVEATYIRNDGAQLVVSIGESTGSLSSGGDAITGLIVCENSEFKLCIASDALPIVIPNRDLVLGLSWSYGRYQFRVADVLSEHELPTETEVFVIEGGRAEWFESSDYAGPGHLDVFRYFYSSLDGIVGIVPAGECGDIARCGLDPSSNGPASSPQPFWLVTDTGFGGGKLRE